MIFKTHAHTCTRYGCFPKARSISDLLRSSVINLDKPPGPTSHQVTKWVKDIVHADKAGHGGTLDPGVTGVLPIALNRATKALSALLHGKKEYVCVMEMEKIPKKVSQVLSSFVGEITQIPPKEAAVKRRRRKRRIYALDLLESEGKKVLFRVRCDPGTYIRTLVTDVGKRLGCRTRMSELRRIKSCIFCEDDAVKLQDLKDAYEFWKAGDGSYLRKILLPQEKLVEHLPKLLVRDSAIDALCHGASLAVPGIVKLDDNIRNGQRVAILSLKGELIALGKALMSTDQMLARNKGLVVKTQSVVMSRGTYPRVWGSNNQKKLNSLRV